MIEMLGVLALVGVLSVGGVAGYSKAMWMYKTNKQAEQFGIILRALINNKEQFNIHLTEDDFYTVTPYLKAMGEIPDEMIIPNDNTYIKDAFGLRYWIYHGASPDHLGIRLQLSGSKDTVNICKNIYQLGKNFSQDIYYMIIWKTENASFGLSYGDKFCTAGRKCLKNLAPHDIADLCQACKDGDYCGIFFNMWDY